MAAYAALLSLSQVLEKALTYNTIPVHDKQYIQSLHDEVILLQKSLEDCPEKFKSLEGRIRDAANEAQDMIELGQIEAIGRREDSWLLEAREIWKGAKSPKYTYNFFSLSLKNKIKEINCVVKEAIEMKKSDVKEATETKKSDAQEDDNSPIHSSSISASSSRLSPSSKDTVVGFEDDLLKIKDRLCGSSSKLQIIPIVGMGGIGKTTLAKVAYENPLIVQHFDVRGWATVSQNYCARDILQGLLRSIAKSNEERCEEIDEFLQEMIHKTLKGRRYLIVMDDMWSTNVLDDCNGSRIVVTTRMSDVAVYTDDGSSLLHEMQLMDDELSWKLLQKNVFGQEQCPLELKEIGKMVARNCRGLPLAIVVIGGVLSKVDRMEDAWRKIGESVGKVVNTGDAPFTKILCLSYDHLPHHLRPCFLYLGGFPEDYEIKISALIKLWVAEGLLKPSRSKSLEEVAEDNLKDLLKRNLIMGGIRRRSNGQIRTIKIHDLLRDICLEKAREEEFILPYNYKQGNKILVRRSLYAYLAGRSFYYRFEVDKQLLECLQGFKLLWVLNALHTNFNGFPTEVVKLFHLRYLAFTSHENDLTLPRSILKLQNLQTLIVCQSSWSGSSVGYLYLPSEIWGLQELRHLMSSVGFLPNFDGEYLALINLQTLSSVDGFRCSEKMLETIPNVKKLGLHYSDDAVKAGWSKYELQNLVYFNKLEKLKVKCGFVNIPLSRNLVAFPHSLTRLTLEGIMLRWTDMTIVGSLPDLEVLKLKDSACEGDKWETNEGEFRKLKMLLIDRSFMSSWIVESPKHFPKLEYLVLRRCYRLDEIPYSVGEIPTLQLIEMSVPNSSLLDSAKHIQAEQQSLGNDVLQVKLMKGHITRNHRSYDLRSLIEEKNVGD